MEHHNRRRTDPEYIEGLDYIARKRMNESYRNENYLILLICVGMFVLGIITGSVLHDIMFHALER